MTKNSLVSIGKISGTFGLKGHLKIDSSGDILNNLNLPAIVLLGEKQDFSNPDTLEMISLKKNKDKYIVLFGKIDTIEKAEKLKNKILYLDKSDIPALTTFNEFYIYQLIGLAPVSNNKKLSDYKLKEVMDNPAHPILIFDNGEREVLVPFLEKFVNEVDLVNLTIEIPDWETWIED